MKTDMTAIYRHRRSKELRGAYQKHAGVYYNPDTHKKLRWAELESKRSSLMICSLTTCKFQDKFSKMTPGFFINTYLDNRMRDRSFEDFDKKWSNSKSLSEEEIYQAVLDAAEAGWWINSRRMHFGEVGSVKVFGVTHICVTEYQLGKPLISVWIGLTQNSDGYHYYVDGSCSQGEPSEGYSCAKEAFEAAWKLALERFQFHREQAKEFLLNETE